MRRVTTFLVVAMLAVGLMAAPAMAKGPADGQCVSNGVQVLGGKGLKLISAAATGGLESYTGVRNSVPIVIADHLFNNADVTEAVAADLLGVGSVTICG